MDLKAHVVTNTRATRMYSRAHADIFCTSKCVLQYKSVTVMYVLKSQIANDRVFNTYYNIMCTALLQYVA